MKWADLHQETRESIERREPYLCRCTAGSDDSIACSYHEGLEDGLRTADRLRSVADDLCDRAGELLWDIDRPENGWNDRCFVWLTELKKYEQTSRKTT